MQRAILSHHIAENLKSYMKEVELGIANQKLHWQLRISCLKNRKTYPDATCLIKPSQC
jgi:hypothetical protein